MSGIARTARMVPTLLRTAFAAALAYRSQFLVWILATNTPLVMLALWSSVSREAAFGRFGQRQFVAYFLVTLVVRLLTGTWVVWEMNLEIRDGTLAQRLLRPLHPFIVYATDNLAGVPLRAVVSLPVAIVVLLTVGGSELTRDPVLWLIAPLSGHLFPLSFFPRALGRWVAASPFPYTLSFPVEAMLGMMSRSEALSALATQWGYGAAFLAVSLVVWQRGLRRYAAYGG